MIKQSWNLFNPPKYVMNDSPYCFYIYARFDPLKSELHKMNICCCVLLPSTLLILIVARLIRCYSSYLAFHCFHPFWHALVTPLAGARKAGPLTLMISKLYAKLRGKPWEPPKPSESGRSNTKVKLIAKVALVAGVAAAWQFYFQWQKQAISRVRLCIMKRTIS